MASYHVNNIRSLSRFTLSVSILWFVFCVIAFSDAGLNMLGFIAALYIAGTWGIIWLIRLVIAWRRHAKKSVPNPQHFLRYWLVEPAVIIIPLLLAFSGVFSTIRFVLSEPALSRYAENVRAGKVDLAFEFSHPARQVGLYSVTFTDLLADGTVRMITSSDGMMDKAGFANSPHSPPPRQGEDSYQHIHQHWWYWHESW